MQRGHADAYEDSTMTGIEGSYGKSSSTHPRVQTNPDLIQSLIKAKSTSIDHAVAKSTSIP